MLSIPLSISITFFQRILMSIELYTISVFMEMFELNSVSCLIVSLFVTVTVLFINFSVWFSFFTQNTFFHCVYFPTFMHWFICMSFCVSVCVFTLLVYFCLLIKLAFVDYYVIVPFCVNLVSIIVVVLVISVKFLRFIPLELSFFSETGREEWGKML